MDGEAASGPRPGTAGPRRERIRWAKRALVVLGALLLVWTCVGLVALLSAARSADEGIAAMQRARQATGSLPALVRSLGAPTEQGAVPGVEPGGDDTLGAPSSTDPLDESSTVPGADATVPDLTSTTADETPTATTAPMGARAAARELRQASDDFSAAADHSASGWLAPLRALPVLGRQLRAVESLATAATSATADAADALDELVGQLEADTGGSAARLEAARQAQITLQGLRDDLADLDLGPSEALFPPVGSARDRFVAERDQLDQTLETATTGLAGVVSFLQGPTRYLVLAANNAEMRAGSGMYLAAGEMTVQDGQFQLGDVVPTQPLQRPWPATTLDPDVANLWGWTSPDRDLRNVNVTPRFDESARMAADIWRAAGGNEVQGVLALDVRGLKDLLEVVGPVQVQGPDGPVTVSAGSVDRTLLLDQYRRFTEADVRRDLLGDVAKAVFEAFNQRRWSAAGLVGALEAAGSGRDLLLWSRDPVQQDAWKALGAAGSISPDSLLVSVINRGGNKLDQFLDVRPTLTWETSPDDPGLRRMTVTVQVANTAPERLPRYIEGPYPGTDLQPGEYRGILALEIPAGAGNPAVEGAPLVLAGDDGPARTVAAQVELIRGATQVVTFTFDLPTSWTSVLVLPSARLPQVRWVVDGEELPPRRPVEVSLGAAS